MEISNHVLKLQGKAELPQPIELGQNYHIALSGSVRTSTDADNDNGTLTRIYVFKPIKVELLNELGETIKLRDTRSNSQLVRSLLYKKWANAGSNIDFDEFYTRFSGQVMMEMDKLIDRAGL